MTAEALSRPVCTATIGDHDRVTVSIDGVERNFESMNEAISYLAGTADDLGRPLLVTAVDPSSTQPETRLIINRDGSVAEEPPARAKKRTIKRSAVQPRRSETSARARQEGDGPAASDDPETHPPTDTTTLAPSAHRMRTEAAGQQHQPAGRAVPATWIPAAPTPAPATGHESIPADPAAIESDPPGTAGTDDPRFQLRREERLDTTAAAAREGWRGWFNTRFKARLGVSAAEKTVRDRRSRIQRPLDTHRTVATVQLKGGGTKTTVTYYVAATYGRVRGGNILAGEVNENQGTLAERARPAAHERSTLDLIRNLATVTRRTSDLVRYVRPQGDDRIHVLASPPEGADRRRVDGSSVKAAHDVLRSLYNLILLDTGNSAQASTWRAAVEVADALVFVAQNKEDDCRLLEATVEAVRAEGHTAKLVRSILVVTNTSHPSKERLHRLKEYAGAIGLARTIVVPFDPSLQEGRAFDYDALAPSTRRAYEEATAALTEQL